MRLGRYVVTAQWSGWRTCLVGWVVAYRFAKVFLGPMAVSVVRA